MEAQQAKINERDTIVNNQQEFSFKPKKKKKTRQESIKHEDVVIGHIHDSLRQYAKFDLTSNYLIA